MEKAKYWWRSLYCRHPEDYRDTKTFLAKDRFHFIYWEVCDFCRSVISEEII